MDLSVFQSRKHHKTDGFKRWVTKDELDVWFISGFSEMKAVRADFHCSIQLNYADDLLLASYLYVNI